MNAPVRLAELKSADAAPAGTPAEAGDAPPALARRWVVPVLLTLLAVAAAVLACWAIWDTYEAAPWTRDGRVRAYTVSIAPEVSGRIVELPVADNQFVHKGDVLMVIDPTDFAISVSVGQAQLEQAKSDMENKRKQAERRQQLTTLSTSTEEKQNYTSGAAASAASYQQSLSNLAQAQVNLRRTRIVSPVNGWVTNLLTRQGDYATTGQRNIAVVDADSFWVDGYFEETNLEDIREGDPAVMRLMGYERHLVRGHVQSVARGINVANAAPDQAGLASVNPVFTWVRLAQRVPVRVAIDEVPDGVRLVAGLTATIQVNHPGRVPGWWPRGWWPWGGGQARDAGPSTLSK